MLPPSAAGEDKGSCGCSGKSGGKDFGVFQNANDACDAAAKAFLQLREQGVEARRKIIEIVKGMCEDNADEWGRIELEESKIGRLDHKIEKLHIIRDCRESSGSGRTAAAATTASLLRSTLRSAWSAR